MQMNKTSVHFGVMWKNLVKQN